MIFAALRHWRFALIAALAVALAVQSARLSNLRASIADQARATAEADLVKSRAAIATIMKLRDDLQTAKEIERALPNSNSCGLDAGRVRLLPRIADE